jgi:hypothetical protein
MAAGGSALFEKEVAEYLFKGTALKVIEASKLYLGFCEVSSKKAANWAVMKELQGEAGKGYPERKPLENAALKFGVTEQEGALGEAGKGALLQNSAEAKIFIAVPGTVTNPKVKFAFIARHTSTKFAEGEVLFEIPVSPEVEILSTTTEFSFVAKELTFEVL